MEDALPDKRIARGIRHWPKGFPMKAVFRVRQWDCLREQAGIYSYTLNRPL